MSIVKIGREWINVDKITAIFEEDNGTLALWGDGGDITRLTAERATVFRHWLDRIGIDLDGLHERSMAEAEAQVAREKAYAPMPAWTLTGEEDAG
jgi:hypothetical protein